MIDAVFAALADPTRREIISRLARNGPMPSGRLIDGLDMTRQGASRHLDVLEQSGLVTSEKRGRTVVRNLNREELMRTVTWIDSISSAWDERLARLEAMYR